MNARSSSYVTIEPHIMPRDPLDTAVGLSFGVLHLVVVILVAWIPAYAVTVLTHYTPIVVLVFVTAFIAMALFPYLFVVRRLRCDEEGLEFVRLHGSPGKIRWADIESIEAVSRSELVLQGWLWPRFPMREMTESFTSVGHYRIRWRGGVAYFPPRDIHQFLYALQIGRQYADMQRRMAVGYSRLRG